MEFYEEETGRWWVSEDRTYSIEADTLKRMGFSLYSHLNRNGYGPFQSELEAKIWAREILLEIAD